jgi:hypothetical protein
MLLKSLLIPVLFQRPPSVSGDDPPTLHSLSGLAFTIQSAVMGAFGIMRRVDCLQACEIASCRAGAGEAGYVVVMHASCQG